MNLSAPVRLPVHLESAVQRARMAARTAAERTVDSLGLAALSSTSVFQRDGLLGAQFELNRKLAIFSLTFNECLDSKVARELGRAEGHSSGAGLTSWDALSLVDDHEVEIQVSADRFALEINHACEWEIRELDAYMGTLLGIGRPDPERNPLRAEVIGQSMIRAVEAVAERSDVRKVLATEIGRALAQAMRETYQAIVADLRNSGIKPVGLAVRQRPGGTPATGLGGFDGGGQWAPDTGTGHHELTGSGRLATRFGAGGPDGFAGSSPGGLGRAGAGGAGPGGSAGTSIGRVDAPMMSVIRRLSRAALPVADGGWTSGYDGIDDGGTATMAPNLIAVHREELRRAASGAIDHMVIDVIAGLFDQILSDPKVAPQIARQIARLQLPVLRAALGDTSFFSSRKHPVRRFVNRIASLGSAVDDFEGPEGQALLARVRSLVQEVVEGDFDQIETYERKLVELETFIADQAKARLQADGGADQVLDRKEQHLRVQQRFGQVLASHLQPLPIPEFLRQFLGRTWSRAIASAVLEAGADSAPARRTREVGVELVLSVQPKSSPAHRTAFLRQLPQLMKDLNAGLDRIRADETLRREFFAQLLPAHAQSLKAPALSTLDHNLLAKQVESAMATPVPRPGELPAIPASALPVLTDAVRASDFSPEEAKTVGLVDESSVNWDGKVDVDLSAEPEVTAGDIAIAGLPEPEAVEPTRGKSLADHVQIGFAYQMHLEGAWTKVRLTHVSAARSFFVFSHGAKQRKTISMTYRMLARMCETGRMRAFENAYLIERATARARRQLAQLGTVH